MNSCQLKRCARPFPAVKEGEGGGRRIGPPSVGWKCRRKAAVGSL